LNPGAMTTVRGWLVVGPVPVLGDASLCRSVPVRPVGAGQCRSVLVGVSLWLVSGQSLVGHWLVSVLCPLCPPSFVWGSWGSWGFWIKRGLELQQTFQVGLQS
jgi:hypothetical protein